MLYKSLAVFLNKQPNLGKGLTRGILPRLKLGTIAVDLFTIIFKADKLPQLVHRPPIFSFEIVEDVFENKTAGDLLTARAQGSKGGEKRRPRLRVVHHLPLGIVERPKRELAGKSPHARKAPSLYLLSLRENEGLLVFYDD